MARIEKKPKVENKSTQEVIVTKNDLLKKLEEIQLAQSSIDSKLEELEIPFNNVLEDETTEEVKEELPADDKVEVKEENTDDIDPEVVSQ